MVLLEIFILERSCVFFRECRQRLLKRIGTCKSICWRHLSGVLEQNEGSNNVEDPDSTVLETAPSANPRRGTPPIEDLIEEGQEIIVQVSKDPISTKGARIKTHITLPGRFMVCMPTVDHVGISKRIDKEKEKKVCK